VLYVTETFLGTLRRVDASGLPRREVPKHLTLPALAERYWARVGWGGTPYPLPVWMHDREVEELVWQAWRDDLPQGHVVEVGCGWGASSFALAEANREKEGARGEHLFCFDPFNDGCDCHTHRQSQAYRAMRGQERAHLTLGTSDLVPVLFPPGSVRLALIDGDHSSEWARRDLSSVGTAMAEGGMILIHDVPTTMPEEPDGPGLLYREVQRGEWPGLTAEEPRIVTLGVIRIG